MALPWMESLGVAATQAPTQRIAWFYVPIGVVRRGFFPGEGSGPIPKFSSNRQALENGVEIQVGLQRDSTIQTRQ